MKVTSGPVAIRYYPTPVRTNGKQYESWTVVTPDGRKRFPTRKEARKHAQAKADQLAAGHARTISGEERASIDRALQLLAPTGRAIEVAAAEYAQAFALTKGASLAAIAEFWNLHHADLPAKTVARAVSELVQSKESQQLSKVHIRGLKYELERFSKAFAVNLLDISGPMVNEWLNGLRSNRGKDKEPISPQTAKNYLRSLNILFNFAKDQGYLRRDWDELRTVTTPKGRPTPIEIFTPDEMTRLLATTSVQHRLFIAITGFAGVRHAELRRLDWRDINLDSGYITVPAHKAKTASRRIVPISENLYEWLKPHWLRTGPVLTWRDTTHIQERVNVPWKHNGLRHSFVSYRLAQTQDAAKVALEAGNSPKMVFAHYREIVTPEQAAQWFDVRPETCRKIAVQFNARPKGGDVEWNPLKAEVH